MFNRFYEDELNKLKTLAVEFAQHNPTLAPLLSGASADPDVERLLEGVAFLTGLTRQKLDDEFPEFVQELANLLFPHYLRPLPASTLIRFTPKGPLAEMVPVAAGTALASVPVDGTPCRFRTTSDVIVQPLAVRGVRLLNEAGSKPQLVIDFDGQGLDLAQWQSERLRLFLSGGYGEAAMLLLVLCNHVTSVCLGTDEGTRVELGPRSIEAVGFDEELLPYPGTAFKGYRRLQEFFVQPEKFLFVEIAGMNRWRDRGTCTGFSLTFTLDHLPDWMPEIHDGSVLLNVVPAINLFEHAADPINQEHRASDYRVIPEGRNRGHYLVYAVDHVTGYQQGIARERVYQPFGLHSHDGRAGALTYHTTLRAATIGRGNDVFLSVNYPPGDLPLPETLSIGVTCTNGALPESLKLGDVSQPTSTSPDRLQFGNIRPIRAAQEPPVGEALLWRLISHVSLNYLSLADARNLRTMLSIYVFGEHQEQGPECANRRRIAGIESVEATPETRLIGRGSVLRGQAIRIRCRQDHYAGIGDLYLFGCVLERFFGEYASVNSYTRVELEDAFSGVAFKWPARLGSQPLL